MEIQEIDVIINPDGTLTLQVRGVKGQKCRALSEDLERLLGAKVLERTHTPEYDETQSDTLEQGGEIRHGL
jgi:hypothetical protein